MRYVSRVHTRGTKILRRTESSIIIEPATMSQWISIMILSDVLLSLQRRIAWERAGCSVRVLPHCRLLLQLRGAIISDRASSPAQITLQVVSRADWDYGNEVQGKFLLCAPKTMYRRPLAIPAVHANSHELLDPTPRSPENHDPSQVGMQESCLTRAPVLLLGRRDGRLVAYMVVARRISVNRQSWMRTTSTPL